MYSVDTCGLIPRVWSEEKEKGGGKEIGVAISAAVGKTLADK